MAKNRELVIDAHVHVGPTFHSMFHEAKPKCDIDELLRRMDENRIDMAVLIPAGLYGEEMQYYYQLIHKAIKLHPDRFVGFVRVNPHFRDESLREIEIGITEYGMKGIKLHPQFDVFPANSSLVFPIMEKAYKLGVPVLFHSGDIPYALPGEIVDIAEKFPEVPVIMGHMGKTECYQAVLTAAMRSKNVFLETSMCPVLIEFAAQQLGSKHILYGSNWPATSIKAEITKIRYLNLNKADKQMILGGNIAHILNL